MRKTYEAFKLRTLGCAQLSQALWAHMGSVDGSKNLPVLKFKNILRLLFDLIWQACDLQRFTPRNPMEFRPPKPSSCGCLFRVGVVATQDESVDEAPMARTPANAPAYSEFWSIKQAYDDKVPSVCPFNSDNFKAAFDGEIQ